MADASYFLRPLSALQALEKVLAISAPIFAGKQVTVSISTSINPLSLSVRDVPSAKLAERQEISQFRQQLERSKLPIACTGFEISAQGQSGNQKPTVQYSTSDQVVGQISINNFNDSNSIVAVSDCLADVFELLPRHQIIMANLPAPHQEALRFQANVTAEFQAEVAKIATFNLEQLKRQDEFFRKLAIEQGERNEKREAELAEKHRRNEEEIRTHRQSLDDDHRVRLNALEEREREHLRRVQEHDTRESTAVRRELLTKIESLLENEKEVKVSADTVKKRTVIHCVCVVSMLLAVGLVVNFSIRVAADSAPLWHHVTPLSAGLVLFASTLVYYVKWTDQWFREHARVEFQDRKLRSDIVRASWLAELVFEGRDKNRELPTLLVERYSDGLFTDAVGNPVDHPSDQVVSFLQKLSNIKVGQGTVEVTKSAAKEN